jgi:hypothetical protein
LTQAAAQQGQNPDERTQDVFARYSEEEARFVEALPRIENPTYPGRKERSFEIWLI